MGINVNKYIQLKRTSRSAFSIPYFLITFCLLAGFFYVYVGITTPGGKTYSLFLDQYLNITNWLTWLIAKASLLVLKLSGFIAYQRFPNNVTIAGSRGVTILWACLGLSVMSFWTAFVLAHKASWQFKLKWCFTGIVLITVLNITRIVLIAVANHYHWDIITSLEPHETFNIVSYVLIFGLMAWFIRRHKQHQKNQVSIVAKPMPKTAAPITLPS